MEQTELEHPSARKILPGRIIYRSQRTPITGDSLVVCDFGAAKMGEVGEKYTGDAMPGFYRAPEIIMAMEWNGIPR
jgi:hypothetical protein